MLVVEEIFFLSWPSFFKRAFVGTVQVIITGFVDGGSVQGWVKFIVWIIIGGVLSAGCLLEG